MGPGLMVAGESLQCYKCVSGLANMIGYEDCGDMGTQVRLSYSVLNIIIITIIIIIIVIIITGAGDMRAGHLLVPEAARQGEPRLVSSCTVLYCTVLYCTVL